MPVSQYLQTGKPLFSSSFVHYRDCGGTPPEEFSAPAAAPGDPQRKRGSLKPPVHLSQLFYPLPNLFNFLPRHKRRSNFSA
jgi:hypothetical protein